MEQRKVKFSSFKMTSKSGIEKEGNSDSTNHSNNLDSELKMKEQG